MRGANIASRTQMRRYRLYWPIRGMQCKHDLLKRPFEQYLEQAFLFLLLLPLCYSQRNPLTFRRTRVSNGFLQANCPLFSLSCERPGLGLEFRFRGSQHREETQSSFSVDCYWTAACYRRHSNEVHQAPNNHNNIQQSLEKRPFPRGHHPCY